MAAPQLSPTPDVVDKLAQVHQILGTIQTTDYAGLASDRQREAAGLLARLKARASAHELAAVAALDASDVARRQGAASTGALLSGDFGGDRRGADRTTTQASFSHPVSLSCAAASILQCHLAFCLMTSAALPPGAALPNVYCCSKHASVLSSCMRQCGISNHGLGS